MPGKKILIVDDSETIRQRVSGALENAGFETLTAKDGVEGLVSVQQEAPAMVILDVNMPRMNGLDMLDNLDVKTTGLPVLLLTTEVQPSLMARAKQAGAKGWMVKPVSLERLVDAVRKVVASP
ncbi:MAG TPA: response regulator [Polyangiaceae bacterium]|jgi:two-component system chemotaxis response regulator CheY|nr:response regulator [Polyangiaceae bacterium]